MARIDTRNSSRYWRDPHVPGLSCLAADFTSHEYAPHSHDAFVVAVTEAGGSEFKSRGSTEEASAATLLVFNPAEPHSGRMGWSKRWRYRGLYLSKPAIEAVGRSLGIGATPYFTANAFKDEALVASFLALHQALDDGRDALEEHELLVSSFGVLFRRHGSGGEPIPAAPRDRELAGLVQALMNERYTEELTLDEMGAVVGLTPFQLIGLFKRATGLTPHAYLTQVRLKAALRELKAGTPIVEAALAAGFCDQSALNKHFKRCFGITPLQWLRATRG
ncbi:AraC-type DNA-binding protein [Bosea sp. OK403]|uniref:AraC family transcriptional regulator n=1 Tax=Bosea sp. OK403 TaxID=1855286 RepID=UPI0008ED86AF|nr:AraC family transcriptional regulator [Bosea sp. OK403]SFJ83805.1 AraC-type DNA-binding protein [Bosea sp. OK403]